LYSREHAHEAICVRRDESDDTDVEVGFLRKTGNGSGRELLPGVGCLPVLMAAVHRALGIGSSLRHAWNRTLCRRAR
jgi:hypothetical protein